MRWIMVAAAVLVVACGGGKCETVTLGAPGDRCHPPRDVTTCDLGNGLTSRSEALVAIPPDC